jgi:hypothetical protein
MGSGWKEEADANAQFLPGTSAFPSAETDIDPEIFAVSPSRGAHVR